jgi:hypothetical protein
MKQPYNRMMGSGVAILMQLLQRAAAVIRRSVDWSRLTRPNEADFSLRFLAQDRPSRFRRRRRAKR